jgi:hypothetical protein
MILSTLRFIVDTDDTSIEVMDGSLFPQNQVFDLQIDEEIMHGSLVTGNVISVNRGQHGTSAAVHVAGTPVNLVILDEKFHYSTAKSIDDVPNIKASLIPTVDDDFWIGQIASPYLAFKGLVIKDTFNSKHYKIEVTSGIVVATALD